MNILAIVMILLYFTWMFLLNKQAQSALAWGDDDPDAGDSDSEVGDGGGGGAALSKERKQVEEAKEQAEAEARETAEEKRLRLARDVLMKLDAEQRENVSGSEKAPAIMLFVEFRIRVNAKHHGRPVPTSFFAPRKS